MPGGILALDPSSVAVGWAYADPGEPEPIWGNFRPKRPGETARDHSGEIGSRFGIFLEARIEILQPRYIVREQPWLGPPNYETLFPLLGLAWQIDKTAVDHRIECRQTPTMPAVKFLTGKGKYDNPAAKKRATIAACKLHGWNCTEDEADALAILCYAEAELFPEFRRSMKRPAGPLFAASRSGTRF